MNKGATIREILPEEYPFMEAVMDEAIYYPDPENPYPREVIYLITGKRRC